MSDAISQQITVSPILPAMPLVLCDPKFTHTLAVIEREVASLIIATTQDAQLGSTLLQRLTGAGNMLEKARVEQKAPFIQAGREIDAAAANPAARIESAKRLIKTKVTAYEQEQAEVARKAEAARQAELRRLEEIQRKEQAERDRKTAELARQAAEAQEKARLAAEAAVLAGKPAPKPVVDLDDWDGPQEPAPKTATELEIERVKFAPVVVAAKPVGISYKTFLVIDKVDAALLPDQFVTREPKLAAIRATFCVGFREGDKIPELPGCTFKIDKQVASTGRSVF